MGRLGRFYRQSAMSLNSIWHEKKECGVRFSHYLHGIMFGTNNAQWVAVEQRAGQIFPSNFICTVIIINVTSMLP